jgi:hypothetical protein
LNFFRMTRKRPGIRISRLSRICSTGFYGFLIFNYAN